MDLFCSSLPSCPPPARNASQREAGGSRGAQPRRAGTKVMKSNPPPGERTLRYTAFTGSLRFFGFYLPSRKAENIILSILLILSQYFYPFHLKGLLGNFMKVDKIYRISRIFLFIAFPPVI